LLKINLAENQFSKAERLAARFLPHNANSYLHPPTKNPGTLPGVLFASKVNRDQTAIAAFFRFLRQPSRPNAPRPVAKSGRAPGSGTGETPVPFSGIEAVGSNVLMKYETSRFAE
jgi:hypothetical protein